MFKKFLSDRSGNFALGLSLIMVPVMGAVAGVVEFSSTNREASQLQSSLDIGLFAAAARYDRNLTSDELDAYATKIFETNLASAGIAGSDFNYLGATEDASGNVTLSAVGKKPFIGNITSMFNGTIVRNAAVVREIGGTACVLALSQTASRAIKLSGTTDVTLASCVLAANSTAADSVDRSGSANLSADCIQTAGGTYGITGDARVALDCGNPRENSFRTKDPLASLVPPSGVGCANLNIPGGKGLKSINPGVYCNNNLTINGGSKVRFNPGTYVFKGTDISILGGAEVTGTDVTIFLFSGAQLNIAANALFTISAPTTGLYSGVAIYSEAANPVVIKLNGGSTQSINGFIYNPKGSIEFSGNSATASDQCIRLVADTITMTGKSALKADCSTELGGKDIKTVKQIRLVN